MFKLAKPFFIICETPLHAGSGSDLGIVDMPIQRERHTDFPKIEGSGLKGSIREVFEEMVIFNRNKYELADSINVTRLKDCCPKIGDEWKKIKIKQDGKEQEITLIRLQENIFLAFGPEEGDAHAGALGFTDARTLLFPVKSMKGVFAWITCPKVLEKLKEDLKLCKIDFINEIPNVEPGNCLVCSSYSKVKVDDSHVILEEYAFNIANKNDISQIADCLNVLTEKNINERLVILSDEDFKDFVNLSTEVITRTKIDNATGTVAHGQLFT